VSGPFVVDASVAVKWVLPEVESNLAEDLVAGGALLHAPAFIFLELANALWKKMRQGGLSEEQATDRVSRLRRAPLILWQGEEPLPATLGLARQLDHAVYDCAYLALALELDAVYVTADQGFWRKVQANSLVQHRIVLLRDLARDTSP
jgi:predicted nucleic acid-binding protein